MSRLPFAELSPAALQGMLAAKQALIDGPLGAPLVELLFLRISQINGCAYCLDKHATALRQAGESNARLDTLAGWRESPHFNPRERAALAWAEAITYITAPDALDTTYPTLQAHFSDQEISDLTYVAALMNGLNRLAVAMHA